VRLGLNLCLKGAAAMTRKTSVLSTLLVVLGLLLSSTPPRFSADAGSATPQGGKAEAAVEEVSGLRRVVITDKHNGKIYVNLTRTLAAGSTVSGTVFVEPAGKNEEERAANLKRLKEQSVEIAGQKFSAAGQTFELRIPAAESQRSIDVVLRDKKGKELARAALPAAAQAPAPATSVRLPAHAQAGDFFEIECPCDGVMREGDYVKIARRNVPVVAKAIGKIVAYDTSGEQGLREVEVSEGGQVTKGLVSLLTIRLSVLQHDLMRDQKTTLTVEVGGLDGLREPARLRLANLTTHILTMEPANVQEFTINPSDVRPGGSFTITRELTGVQVGAFRIAGTVLWRADPPNEFNVTVADNRLAFKTIEDYERVVNNPTEELRAAFMKAADGLSGFTSYGESLRSRGEEVASLIEDEYFASIVNADLAVQIGEHIFRVNPPAEKVYVLPAANASQYQDLVSENIANKSIRVFSTGDSVLEVLKSPTPSAVFCNQSGIGGKHATLMFSGGGKMAAANFNRYGIYFSLSAIIVPVSSLPLNYLFDFSAPGNIHYRIRCGGTVDYKITTPGYWTGISQRYQSYQGSRNLNELFFGFRVKYKSTGTPLSGYVVIRQNW
jgi:hypothetical protein